MTPEAKTRIAELNRMVVEGELPIDLALKRAMQFAFDHSREACNKAAAVSTDPTFKCGCAHAAHEVEKLV